MGKEVIHMSLTNINPQDLIFALDIGTRTVIGTVGAVKEKKFHIISENYVEHQERAMVDGQIHDITLVANAVAAVKKQLENDMNMRLSNVSIAAAGRFLRTTVARADIETEYDIEIDKDTIRSLELTAVKKAEEQISEQAEGKLYCVGYSVKNYYLNDYVISNLLSHKGDRIAVEVIATFLPRSVVESLYAVMDKVGLNVVNLTLEPIAAMEAAIPQSLRLLNLALVDIGAGTSDVAISSKDTISAYGMVSMAGDEVTEIIAQNYLVDFNTAERIKRECTIKDSVTYVDVLGLENEINSDEIFKIINPTVSKIADEISSKIIELNGGKAPNAVFLVGGGAHTPMLKDLLAEKLNLPLQRLAIKGRDAVIDCVCTDNSLGSTGVTVLGIALNSIKKLGHDFIDVTLNGNVISLFNSHKHSVMDVMMQAGINPKVLIGKNGKNIKFMLNGIKRVAFGTLGTNAKILLNNKDASIDSEVKEGDNIEIDFAKDGKDAKPKVMEYVKSAHSISFYIDDIIINMDPVIFINDSRALPEETINDGDNVRIIFPSTLNDYKKYFERENLNFKYHLNGAQLSLNYNINEGDRIYREIETEKNQLGIDEAAVSFEANTSEIKDDGFLEEKNIDEYEDKTKHTIDEPTTSRLNVAELSTNEINVIVNDNKVKLKNKEKYIFVDIFDFIDFDLTIAKGNLILLLNDKKASYYDELSEGDVIKIYWE